MIKLAKSINLLDNKYFKQLDKKLKPRLLSQKFQDKIEIYLLEMKRQYQELLQSEENNES